PVWRLPTCEPAEEMLRLGLPARRGCVDARAVPADWAGRDYDEKLLTDLPASADPCAETGECHPFVYSGPMFRTSIPIVNRETVQRDGFVFRDLLSVPASASQCAAQTR